MIDDVGTFLRRIFQSPKAKHKDISGIKQKKLIFTIIAGVGFFDELNISFCSLFLILDFSKTAKSKNLGLVIL